MNNKDERATAAARIDKYLCRSPSSARPSNGVLAVQIVRRRERASSSRLLRVPTLCTRRWLPLRRSGEPGAGDRWSLTVASAVAPATSSPILTGSSCWSGGAAAPGKPLPATMRSPAAHTMPIKPVCPICEKPSRCTNPALLLARLPRPRSHQLGGRGLKMPMPPEEDEGPNRKASPAHRTAPGLASMISPEATTRCLERDIVCALRVP